LTVIEDIKYVEKGITKYYEVVAGGRTYRAFDDSVAFAQFKEGKFSKGENVDLKYTEVPSKTNPAIVYKNLDRVEQLGSSSTHTSVTSASAPQSSMVNDSKDVDRQVLIVRQNCVTNAIAYFELNHTRLDAVGLISEESIIATAKRFEEYIWSKDSK